MHHHQKPASASVYVVIDLLSHVACALSVAMNALNGADCQCVASTNALLV